MCHCLFNLARGLPANLWFRNPAARPAAWRVKNRADCSGYGGWVLVPNAVLRHHAIKASGLKSQGRAKVARERLSVVVTRRLPEPVETRLCELFDVRLRSDDTPMTRQELVAALQEADVLVPTVTASPGSARA